MLGSLIQVGHGVGQQSQDTITGQSRALIVHDSVYAVRDARFRAFALSYAD